MRHRVKGRNLSRTASHRKATLRALATSLLKHKKIKTTVAKAKELRVFVEPIITKAKENSVHARRLIASDIQDKDVVKELFNEIVPKIGDRPGGYTRIVKLGNRVGDAADMAIIELVDYNALLAKKEKKENVKKAKTKAAKAEVEDAKVIEETAKTEMNPDNSQETKAEDYSSAEGEADTPAEKK